MKQKRLLPFANIIVSFIVSLVVFVSLLPETAQAAKTYYGVALKNPTHVYKSTSRDSGSWKSYAAGSILKYADYNEGWYRATVKVDGKWQTGYIHKSDVENAAENQQTLRGVALKNPTHVYANASRTSSLKKYATGSILKYRTFTSNWYEATVYINGKPKTGYINRQDVENAVQNQRTLKGIALRQPTAVYKKAAAGASWKTYAAGSILKYRTFTSNWYEATVYINGKPQTGYIHRSDVENAVENQQTLTGIALRKPTAVYKNASTQSSWKTYEEGSILKYRTFSSNWYEATVYVNGKRQTGYIHKSHVENAIPEKERKTLRGIGTQVPTSVYARASTNSKALKSYESGKQLKYRTFSSNWYEATVYIDGKPQTGYIHKSHVDELVNSPKSVVARALKQPTRAYAGASRSSKTLKTYEKNATLKLRELSKNWYEATVYVNGKPYTAFFHKSDVTTEDVKRTTKYNYDLKKMVDEQMKKTPRTDNTNGRGWQNATRNQVEYFTHPDNFKDKTAGNFQFLVLSHFTHSSASELNRLVLTNKDKAGILAGKAQTFVDAARKYQINEVYLIAHALLETGNGKSSLANGIEIGIDKNGQYTLVTSSNRKNLSNIKKVYNMFGIAAIDNNPSVGGAKKAHQENWTTPEKAIEGGAKWIAENYIRSATHQQDTLYKMRWNPAAIARLGYASHQYATDVAWAEKIANRMASIYNQISLQRAFVYDFPQFNNQSNAPKGSRNWQGTTKQANVMFQADLMLKQSPADNEISKEDKSNATFVEPKKPLIEKEQNEEQELNLTGVTLQDVILRRTPSDENDENIIVQVPIDTRVEIIEVGEDWLKVIYNGEEGWILADDVELATE